jgi:geranylgeranyl diphosphate synthase type II
MWDLSDEDYVRMVEQKTCWYSFITPVMVGAIAARQDGERIEQLAAFARSLGIAFQIQDDVLNLRGEVGAYGKEIGGDLWEGKRTLMLLHMMRHVSGADRAEAERILSLPRPSPEVPSEASALESQLDQLVEEGELTAVGRQRLRQAMGVAHHRPAKTPEQVRFLLSLMERHDSIGHAQGVAQGWLRDAQRAFDSCRGWLLPSTHRDLLEGLISYVLMRVK